MHQLTYSKRTKVSAIAHLAKVARVELVHHNPVVVLPTSITAAGLMLAVLANTAMSSRHVTTLLPVLTKSYSRGDKTGQVEVPMGSRQSLTCAHSLAVKTHKLLVMYPNAGPNALR